MTTTTSVTQDEIFSALKNLLVEKGYLTQKDANAGVWTSLAQTAWESYAYHVLGQSMHFLVPNSKEELLRLGIEVSKANVQSESPVVPVKTETRVSNASGASDASGDMVPSANAMKPEPKTLSRVINHDADDL